MSKKNKNIKINEIDIDIIYENRNVTDSSKRQYVYTLTSLKKSKYGNMKLNDLILIINSICRYKSISLSKKRNWLSLLSVAYRFYFNDPKVLLAIGKISKRINMKATKNVVPPTKKFERYLQISNNIDSKLKTVSNDDILDYITMYMYTNIPPRRTDNRLLKFSNKVNPTYPTINMKSHTIHYPPFKRGPSYSFTFDDSLLLSFKKLHSKLGDNLYRSVLSIPQHSGTKAFSLYVKKLFLKYYDFEVNIQQLRRLFSLRDHEFLTRSKNISKAMGHNLSIHNNLYMDGSDKLN